MGARIPPELYEEILFFLWGHTETLLACSTASPVLMVVSQKQLFSRVIIRSPLELVQSNIRFKRLYKVGGSASRFRELIETSPHLATYVKSFQIFDRDAQVAVPSTGDWLSIDQHIPDILLRLCNLKSLAIMYHFPPYHWQKNSAEFMSALVEVMQLPSLVGLSLKGIPMNLLLRGGTPNLKHVSFHPWKSQQILENIHLSSSLTSVKTITCRILHFLKIASINSISELLSKLSDSSRTLNLCRLKKLHIELKCNMSLE
ncbi:hypothetical protein CPB83DRAFT_492446 [Crepidotus variabilis]|uniref:Uncharacterized protein n=1 Tax=Crepidotus variabilis TaxID=179855 RepID=A0A9P6EBX7_9AGAR|nr:hypothetical protein CPB83DRAFT_492446 [Crepidotus variabilis]